MTIRTSVNPDYKDASFLLADHDNRNIRVVHGWDLLERILNINYRMHNEDGTPLYKVWVWDPTGVGSFSSVKRTHLRERIEDERPVTTWELRRSRGAVKVGELDVGPTPDALPELKYRRKRVRR